MVVSTSVDYKSRTRHSVASVVLFVNYVKALPLSGVLFLCIGEKLGSHYNREVKINCTHILKRIGKQRKVECTLKKNCELNLI